MAGKYGIDELKRILDFAMDLVDAGVLSIADGKLSIGDLWNFTPSLASGTKALEHLGDAKAEALELDDAEKAELLAYLDARLKREGFAVQAFIQSALEVVKALAKVYGLFQPDKLPEAPVPEHKKDEHKDHHKD